MILKTNNAGNTWSSITSGTISTLQSAFFNNINTGYVVGAAGTILKTVDSGNTWNTLTTGTTNWLFSVFFTTNNIGYASGNAGTILKTNDGGTTWQPLFSGTTQQIRSIFFTNTNTGYCVGSNGTILKTINGGVDTIINIANQPTNTTICTGVNTTFNIVVYGEPIIYYRWQYNNSGTWNDVVSGIPAGTSYLNQSTATLSVNGNTVSGIYQYRCIVTNDYSTDTSNITTLTVNPTLPVSVSISTSENPTCSGNPVTFTAIPINGGTSPLFYWYINGSYQGVHNQTFTSTNLINNNVVTCVLTSNEICKSGSPATSNAITMTVHSKYSTNNIKQSVQETTT